MPELSGLQEACGVFACVASDPWPTRLDVPSIVCTALVGLQHRGQESAGIVTSDGSDKFKTHKGMGLVAQVFKDDNVLGRLKGNIGIGHTRYSTSGSSDILNCQPFVVETLHGLIALAHNGELVNAHALKKKIRQFKPIRSSGDSSHQPPSSHFEPPEKILENGTGLTTGSDSELITQLLSRPPPQGEPNGPNWTARLKELMKVTLTSYSLVVMHRETVYAVRDPFGNRPLCIGRLLPVPINPPTSPLPSPTAVNGGRGGVGGEGRVNGNSCGNVNGELRNGDAMTDGDGWVIASESCCFESIGAKYYRDIRPGEIVQVTKGGIKSMCIVPRPNDAPPAFCIFEYVYFSRADSRFEGQMVYAVRERCGRRLAMESPVDADLVSTVPESATPAALGYSQQSGVPYAEVLCKNRYVGRTFIQPSTRLREHAVSMKFGVLSHSIVGKRIVLIDDSIVRGNTMRPIVRLLKDHGAKEVHIRLASPPLKYPCYMGINIPTRDELIANKLNLQQLAQHIGADSVVYLTLEGLLDSVRPRGSITACSVSVHSHSDPTYTFSDPPPGPIRHQSISTPGGGGRGATNPLTLPQPDISSSLRHQSISTPGSGGREADEPCSFSPTQSLPSIVPTGCGEGERGHCTACLTGNYPVEIQW